MRFVSRLVSIGFPEHWTGSTYVVLLDNLVESSVVELDKLSQVVDVGNDVGEVFLQQDEFFLARSVVTRATLVEAVDDILDFTLAHSNTTRDLHSLDLLFSVHLVELRLETADEASFVIFGPLLAAVLLQRARGVLEIFLQAIVVNVVPLVLADDAGSQLLSKLHDDDAGSSNELLLPGLRCPSFAAVS